MTVFVLVELSVDLERQVTKRKQTGVEVGRTLLVPSSEALLAQNCVFAMGVGVHERQVELEHAEE